MISNVQWGLDDALALGLDVSHSNLPLAHFCFKWCERKSGIIWPYPNLILSEAAFNAQALMYSVVSYIVGSSADIRWRKNFASEMCSAADEVTVGNRDLRWLIDDKRACYWFWEKVRTLSVEEPLNIYRNHCQYDETFNVWRVTSGFLDCESLKSFQVVYQSLSLSSQPSDEKERYNLILKFFTDWNAPFSLKKGTHDCLKLVWQKQRKRHNFSWLKINDFEQIDWAWGYISEKQPWLKGLGLFGHKDTYWRIISAIDLMVGHPAEIEVFIQKMARAWSQKKFRAKQTDKKALNTHISAEAKDMLDVIVKKRDTKVPDVLESLIKKAYSEM